MKKIIIISLLITGCATSKDAQYNKGYKDCASKVSGVFDYIDILEREQKNCFTQDFWRDRIKENKEQNDELSNRIVELDMQNAALKSANEFLVNRNKQCGVFK